MRDITFFKQPIHLAILFISSIIFAYSMDMVMIDDGLRHLTFAANKEVMKSWGDVFPYSLFNDYDPWFLWHYLLETLLIIIPIEFIHIFINTIVLTIFMYYIYKHVRQEINFDFASLTYLIVFLVALFTSYRYIILRPDLLSGLFIFVVLLMKNRFLPIFILTLLYGPFYYLFFLYTGSIGLVFMVQKKWRSFLGIFTASILVLIFFLFHNYEGYISTVINILTDQSLRMGLKVSEGKPLFDFLSYLNYFILLPLFAIIVVGLIYYKYEYFKNNSLATFLLITSILWVNQYRYFQLFSPLILVYFLAIIVNFDKRKLFRTTRKYFIISKRYFSYSKKAFLFYIVLIPYIIGVVAYMFSDLSSKKTIEEGSFYKSEEFNNKTVLLNELNLDVYRGLYHNPTIKFVPSCSIGWFDNSDPSMKDIYIRMQKNKGISEEELLKLIKYVKADIYIHTLGNNKQVLDFEKLSNYGIVAKAIYNNRIIFKIKKNEHE